MRGCRPGPPKESRDRRHLEQQLPSCSARSTTSSINLCTSSTAAADGLGTAAPEVVYRLRKPHSTSGLNSKVQRRLVERNEIGAEVLRPLEDGGGAADGDDLSRRPMRPISRSLSQTATKPIQLERWEVGWANHRGGSMDVVANRWPGDAVGPVGKGYRSGESKAKSGGGKCVICGWNKVPVAKELSAEVGVEEGQKAGPVAGAGALAIAELWTIVGTHTG
ncbi:hypothetical protein HPP92_008891 [Vanilla planifolia]|uniref:Uncharacterized protein n=1 Tax=Vanilla planifolia TaxID=51239 RepID=A0A835RF66_VANPL|nr:hypothetical protein HPP92_008891 [Vanilla planifolia]